MAATPLVLANVPVTLKDPPAKFRSAVWKYFGFRAEQKEKTTCKICYDDVSYKSGNTSNMATHLKRKHGMDLDETKYSIPTPGKPKPVKPPIVASGQLRLNDVFKSSSKLALTHPRAKALTHSIGCFIACDMRPYSVVQNKGFQLMMHTAEPRYTIPSRAHFSQTVIPGIYHKVRSRVESNIKAAQSVALTTDSWTSRAVESYVTVTAHFITDDWTPENATLQTRVLSDSHTSENLALGLLECVREWNLSSPAITTDNAANIVKAVKEAGFSPHIGCFAHSVNLGVQRGLKVSQLDRLLGRIRRIVSFFHRSTTASSILRATQKKLELKEEKLLMDVSTRWNSTYDMVARYLLQQPAIFSTLTSKDMKKNVKDIMTLSNDDVKLAEIVVDLLKPFKTVTKVMCDTKHPTVSLIHPMKEQLLSHLNILDDDPALLREVKTVMYNDLKQRYTDPEIMNFLLLSCAVDPRFKSLPYIDDNRREDIFSTLHTKAIFMQGQQVKVKQEKDDNGTLAIDPELAQPALPALQLPSLPEDSGSDSESGEPLTKKPKCALDDLFGDVFVTKTEPGRNINERVELEIKNYRSEPLLSLKACPLAWWSVHEDKYPLLAKVAHYILAIPATSVASERVFSTAGDIVTAQRAALDGENVDILIFLKKNMTQADMAEK